MGPTTKITRNMRYRRHPEGATFSLEANTEAVPEPGHYYVLSEGEVLLRTNELASAEAAYQKLCREFWEGRLESADARVRRMSALGLLGQDPCHRAATALIRSEGSAAEQARVELAASESRDPERARKPPRPGSRR